MQPGMRPGHPAVPGIGLRFANPTLRLVRLSAVRAGTSPRTMDTRRQKSSHQGRTSISSDQAERSWQWSA